MGTRAGAGTVTFLFTDLVGSTESLVALGEDRFDSLRDEHDALVGRTIAAHHGEVVKSMGDGFMAAFARAGDAVAAAAEIQRLISQRNEGSPIALGVRVGISAGDVLARGGDYHGVPVVEAARPCAAATAGQVLASETVRSLVGARGGHDFVALGGLDLKGLQPVVTVALRWCEDAPVVAPARGAKGNLPASLDRFIGRHRDRDAIRALLGEHRLVTLTGPGGVGKTRLSLEVGRSIAAEHGDGVWLVDLANINDENLIAEATMAALGVRGSAAAARDAVRSHLSRLDALLVVDNCEHVVAGAAALIAELLAACPLVRVVATSREPLSVPGEREYSVEGLGRDEAIELFAARVPGQRRVDDPGAVGRICAAVEGIPLAIELAAAKLRVLSPAQLADRLDDQLAVLARGTRTAPQRQRTLRATLDWSYDLLDDDERAVFRRLGMFAGGFTPDAAEHVVADGQIPRARVVDLLEQLVERSLLTRVHDGSGARFRLLEHVRQYATARLDEAGEHGALARRHLAWVQRFAQQAFSDFVVAQHDATLRIRDEHPNITRALEFALAIRGAIPAATIIGALGYLWREVGQPDARLWCERVLAALPADAPALTRANALVATALTLQEALQYDAAKRLLLEARELYRGVNDMPGETWALTWLGRNAFFRAPASDEAKTLFEEALSRSRESNQPAGAAGILGYLAQVALHAEDDGLARQRAEEAVQIGRSTQTSQTVAAGLRVLAILDSRAGDFDSSDQRLAESIAINEDAGASALLVWTHATAAQLAASRGDLSRATSHLAQGVDLAREMQISELALEFVATAAYVAYMDGRAHDAAVLFGACNASHPLTAKRPMDPAFPSIVDALEEQDLGEKIAAGANLSADEALEHVAALTLDREVNPPRAGRAHAGL